MRFVAAVREEQEPSGTPAAATGGEASPAGPALPDRPSIAVLPFDNVSGNKDQDHFCDGITDDIITELSRFSDLFVIARNSSFQYKGKAINVREVGRALGVRYILQGSIRREGGRVISEENRGQPIISQAVVHGNVAYFAGITRLSAISKPKLLKCCDASMNFSTSREPTNHSY